MGAVVVVEMHPALLGESQVTGELPGIEDAFGLGVAGAHEFAFEADHGNTALELLGVAAKAAAGTHMGAVTPWKGGTAESDGIDVAGPGAGDGQALVDGFPGDAAAIDLFAGEPLEGDRRDHFIVLEDGGAAVVET